MPTAVPARQGRSAGRQPRAASTPKPAALLLDTRPALPAATSFQHPLVPRRLVTALARSGIVAPFEIQAAALPDALAGNDLLGKAVTGSGKTLAFGVPLLARLSAHRTATRGRPPRGLILLPTRELAQQVADVLTPLGRAVGLRVVAVYGGALLPRQVTALRQGADVVVATPGRLQDLLDRRAVTLDAIETTVLDEADHLCDLGFLPAVRRLLDLTPAGRQRLLFSATLDRDVDTLVRAYLDRPVLVDVTPRDGEVGTVVYRTVVTADREARLRAVAELAGGQGRSLLFVRTQHGADRLARRLTSAGVAASQLHGGMAQHARTRALRAFSEGTSGVLVATDVALVVHVDLPADAKTFLHRSGRTGRAGADGTVVLLALAAEEAAAERLLRAAAPVSAGASPAARVH